MKKIAFIDRDGTLIKEPKDFQVDALEKIEFVPGVFSALCRLIGRGYQLIMVTNQDGLGTASFPQASFDRCHNFILKTFANEGIEFSDILICPHFPKDNCDCRKPRMGLLYNYLNTFDVENSFVVGDRQSDQKLALNMGLDFFPIDQISWSEIADKVLNKTREGRCVRQTKETKIEISVRLDNKGSCEVKTGIRFFDHMLEQIARHSQISMSIFCHGDIDVDDHHTVEDVGLALGESLRRALGDRFGIARFGFVLPMDETLVHATMDLGGRPFSQYQAQFNRDKVGDLATEMVPHFFRSVAENLKANLNIEVRGENTHHQVEASFKAFGRCLLQATQIESDFIPSTKGTL